LGGPLKVAFQPIWFDSNNDGFIDLFIATDLGVSPLYLNNRNGSFREATKDVGICRIASGMGVAQGDFDNNLTLDLYVTNVGANFLWRNDGKGNFSDVAKNFKVSDATSIGWGTSFLDFDNDGMLDLYVANGTTQNWETSALIDSGSKLPLEDKLYRNLRSEFQDVAEELGIGGDYPKKGLAVADYNNDGFVDIFVLSDASRSAGLSRFYKNSGNSNKWLTIRLVGTKSNRDGIGAKIIVTTQNGKQIRQVSSGESFLSQNSLWQTFGLGRSKMVDKIEIKWPSGIIQSIINIKPNQILTITEEN
jgi:hypothetical protein